MKIPLFSSSKTLYRTTLPFQEVEQKLQQVFDAPKSPSWAEFFGKSAPQFYKGSMQEKSFQMQRVIAYQNSFLPGTKGKIRRTDRGSEVEIKTRMNLFGMAFLAVFSLAFIGIFIVFLTMGIEVETAEGMKTIPAWIFLMVLIPIWVIILYVHTKEIGRTRKFLRELFDAAAEPLD